MASVTALKTKAQITPAPKARVSRRSTKHPEVLRQIRVAFENPAAAVMGLAMGGIVPGLGYQAAHAWIPDLLAADAEWWRVAIPVVALGAILLFSAKTVFQWSRSVFRDKWKAAGMVVILETVMLFNPCWWVSATCLVFLIGMNAIANAYNVAS